MNITLNGNDIYVYAASELDLYQYNKQQYPFYFPAFPQSSTAVVWTSHLLFQPTHPQLQAVVTVTHCTAEMLYIHIYA